MKLHANARTCPKSRRLLVRRIEDEGWSLIAAAEAAGISERSASKWLSRWRNEGEAGLADRSSAPKRVPSRLPADRLAAIEALRRLRMTAAEIAEVLGMALSTVSRWLRRIGLGKRSRLEPPEPPNRYERKRPGELIHVDVKKLGRIGPKGAGHRVTGSKRGQANRGRDGRRTAGWSSSTSVSMTPPAWPMSRCSPMSAGRRPRVSCGARSAGSREWESGSSGCSPTTALAIAPPSTPRPARSSACATCAPAPTGPAPTARPRDSSRRSSTAGPTERFTDPRQSAPRRYPAGSITTTSGEDTAPLAIDRPQLGLLSWNNLVGNYS
jgi:transposase